MTARNPPPETWGHWWNSRPSLGPILLFKLEARAGYPGGPWVCIEEIWIVDDEIVNHIQNSRFVCTLPAGYWIQVNFQRPRVFCVFCFRNWVFFFFFFLTKLCLHFSSFGEQRLLSSCGALASHCRGFTLWSTGSGAPAFSSCSTWAQYLCLQGLVAPQHVWSSQTKDGTGVPFIARWSLNHWTTREPLGLVFS